MKRFALKSATPATLAAFAQPLCLCALLCGSPLLAQHGRAAVSYLSTGSVTGTIVDGEGVPQMGALVQLLLPDTSLAATALTDAHGRFRLADITPGAYRVRVSAALFLPVIRQHLLVAGNSRSVVNMTLSSILAYGDWLPAARRVQGEDDDDWMWTMRSSTMRPVLRLAADDDGSDSNSSPVSVSSSAEQSRSIRTEARVTVQDNEGGFARGGTHNVLSLERRSGDTVSILRTDFSGPRTPFPVNPSADISLGWERKLPFAGTSRSILTYTSHPEVQGATGLSGAAGLSGTANPAGLQTAVFRNAQRLELGDAVRLDAGSVTRDVSLGGNSFAVEPFLRIAVHPAEGVVIAYTFTESRGTQSLEDLDHVSPAAPAAFSRNGHVQIERGSHQALSLSGKLPGRGVAEVAVYRDSAISPSIAGIGLLPSLDVATAVATTDPTTASFLVAARNFQATGVRISFQQPIATGVSLNGTFSDGEALRATTAGTTSLQQVLAGLAGQNSISASAGIDGRFQRTGTTLRSGYRWQPQGTLTAVDRYNTADDSAYLHCQLRQSLRSLSMLPANLEAVLEVENLLAQGYEPFLSHDGHTLYLAQSPRVLQAGLSFTF